MGMIVLGYGGLYPGKDQSCSGCLATHFSPDADAGPYLSEAGDIFEDAECAEVLKRYIV